MQFVNNITVLQDFRKKQQNKINGSDSLETLTAVDNDSNFSALIKADSSSKTLVAKDSLQQNISITATSETFKKNIIIKRHNFYFADAGIGVKQQIPIGEQKFVSYNYKGNKTILTDYIPSVYIKLEKEKQWFLQAEFNYASPCFIKPFTYWQKTKADYNHANTTIITQQLQKTFYNQLPLSFNWYIKPFWSVGAGAMYSWLLGAAASEETVLNNVSSGEKTITNQAIPINGFTDSFLYKTQASLLLQTNYEKNRWTFGARYVKDVQPYIAYTLPDGKIDSKKNTSLELWIRYRLFRSDKFRLMNKK